MTELPDLKGRVGLITGGSQGIGRGIACVLGEAGATVYFTGRNRAALESVSDDIKRRGGRGIGLACDHVDDAQVETVFRMIREDHGQLDLLVNNVWGGYENHPHGLGMPHFGRWASRIGTACLFAGCGRTSLPAAWPCR